MLSNKLSMGRKKLTTSRVDLKRESYEVKGKKEKEKKFFEYTMECKIIA